MGKRTIEIKDSTLEIESELTGTCDQCGGELLGEEIETGLCVFCEEGIERETPQENNTRRTHGTHNTV